MFIYLIISRQAIIKTEKILKDFKYSVYAKISI